MSETFQATDFPRLLQAHGLTVPQAMASLKRWHRPYPEAAVQRWLDGQVVPAFGARFALTRAADLPLETGTALARALGGVIEGDDLAHVERLCRAVRTGDPETVADALRDAVIMDGWDAEGRCPLYWAVQAEDVAVARTLLEAGATPMDSTRGHGTAWLAALRAGRAPMIALFIEHGATPAGANPAKNESGYAIVAGGDVDDPDAMEALLTVEYADRDAPVEPLVIAAGRGNKRIVSRLLERGAPVNGRDRNRRFPLHEAAAAGHAGVVSRLIEAGAMVNLRDDNEDTPLHLAARHGHHQCAELLLATGADRERENAAGERPVDRLPAELRGRETGGPAWFDPEGRPIFFAYSKAFVLGFNPRDVDSPFLVGGDHGGIYPAPGKHLLAGQQREEIERYELGWILEFAERAVRREDFTLADLETAARANGASAFTRSEYR
jgi:ankyrin repeat protein